MYMKRYMIFLVAHVLCFACQAQSIAGAIVSNSKEVVSSVCVVVSSLLEKSTGEIVDTLDYSQKIVDVSGSLVTWGLRAKEGIHGAPVDHKLRALCKAAYQKTLQSIFPEGGKKTEALKDESKTAPAESKQQ